MPTKTATTGSAVRSITVNQVGYPIDAAKVAYFTNASGGTFEVIDVNKDAIVYRGEVGDAAQDAASGASVAAGDFSDIEAPGTYQIKYQDQRSAPFQISELPYQELHRGLVKAFYFYRCGTELTEEFAGPFTHKACHTSEGIVHGDPSRRRDGNGGWHDAGDYGKYTGPGAKAVADLLLAYEFYPEAFRQTIPLPETDGVMPDVLHECKWELDWLFKMQDDHGGCFHKLTTLRFPGYVMPEDDTADLYFMPVSATATGDFAGVMAMAARIYKPFDEAYAARCLEAARRAWEWLAANPDVPGFKNPSDVFTGEYGDKVDTDERYWAAAELYRTTGEASYHEAFKKLAAKEFPKYTLGWADMGGYGTIAYLFGGADKAETELYEKLVDGLRKEADALIDLCMNDGYSVALKQSDYIWGSNMVLMNNAMLLLVAYQMFEDEVLEAAALEQVHYMMGRNVLDISYVTGFGDRAYNDPHYRPGVADGIDQAVPGFVAGGPNTGLQDDAMREHLAGKGLAPAACYVDHMDSYAGNEVTIYWNSPAVFALSHWVK